MTHTCIHLSFLFSSTPFFAIVGAALPSDPAHPHESRRASHAGRRYPHCRLWPTQGAERKERGKREHQGHAGKEEKRRRKERKRRNASPCLLLIVANIHWSQCMICCWFFFPPFFRLLILFIAEHPLLHSILSESLASPLISLSLYIYISLSFSFSLSLPDGQRPAAELRADVCAAGCGRWAVLCLQRHLSPGGAQHVEWREREKVRETMRVRGKKKKRKESCMFLFKIEEKRV